VIFHIQTEDSGLKSPHVFTHLFHGGVIVSTRKLVYDGGTVEEGIKALMQSQHKAVMKELKKGTFDAKIDEYLAGTPGLLPAGAAAGSTPDLSVPDPVSSSGSGEITPPPVPMVASAAPISPPARRAASDSVAPLPPAPAGRVSTQDVASALSSLQRQGLISPEAAAIARTITPPRGATGTVPRLAAKAPVQQISAPQVTARVPTANVFPHSANDDVVEIHSPAMPSAEQPPGARHSYSTPPANAAVGQYAQHRRRPSSQIMNTSGAPMPPGSTTDKSRPIVAPSVQSAPVPMSNPRAGSGQVATPVPQAPVVAAQSAQNTDATRRARTPTPARVMSPAGVAGGARRRASTGAGVVMSRPAVIVGGPKSAPNFQTTPRIRSAREGDNRPGNAPISEKSLDDVILAYLSEDAKGE
jgi:hypothetical protein